MHLLRQRDSGHDLSDLRWLCLHFRAEISALIQAGGFDENELRDFVARYFERGVERVDAVVMRLMGVLGLEPPLTYM
jgi:hypothetical protein